MLIFQLHFYKIMLDLEDPYSTLSAALNQLNLHSNVVPQVVVDALASLLYHEANGHSARIPADVCAERERLMRLLAFPHIKRLVLNEEFNYTMVEDRVSIAQALGGAEVGGHFPYVQKFVRPAVAARFMLHDIGKFDQTGHVKLDVPSLRAATFAEIVFLLAKRFDLDLTLPALDEYQEQMADAGYSQTGLMYSILQQFRAKSKKQLPADPVVIMILAVIEERDRLDVLYTSKNNHGSADFEEANRVYLMLREEALRLLAFKSFQVKKEAFVTMCFEEEEKTRLITDASGAEKIKHRITEILSVMHDLAGELGRLTERIHGGPLEVADVPKLAAAQVQTGERLRLDLEMSSVDRQLRNIANSPELDDELLRARSFLSYLRAAVNSPLAQAQVDAWLSRKELRQHFGLLQAELLQAKADLMKLRF